MENNDTVYQMDYLRYGEFRVFIPSLSERETLYEGNEYMINGKKFTINNIVMNDDETQCYIEDMDGPFIYYADDDNNIYKDHINDFIYKIKNEGEIILSMHDDYMVQTNVNRRLNL